MIFNAVEPDFRFHGISHSAVSPILSRRPSKGARRPANALAGPDRPGSLVGEKVGQIAQGNEYLVY